MKSVVYLLLLQESQSIKQNKKSSASDILDDIASGHNEFTHMALKEVKNETPIENIGIT